MLDTSMINTARIIKEYERLLEYAQRHNTNSDLLGQLQEWQQGKWQTYVEYILKRIPVQIKDKTVVDFGCRYGLLSPLLIELGAKKIIGIENNDLFIQGGKQLFADIAHHLTFIKSERGLISLQPETVDITIMNEVISHVNPIYLPVVYAEIARVLAIEGVLFISDGNNLGHRRYFEERLMPLYDAIENGPDGIRAGDVVVQACFLNQRKQFVRSRYPAMAIDHIELLAANTSGLYGDNLIDVIDHFVTTGELIRRPFRRGIAPAYPDSGQVEERGFYPEQVVFDLMGYGFKCEILDRPCVPPTVGTRSTLARADIQPADGYVGYAYQIPLPGACPQQFAGLVMENDQALPLPLDNHAEIAEQGMGRYSIWRANRTIYFSSSDNSDPRENGRKYELYWTTHGNELLDYPSPNFQIVGIKVW